MRDGARDERFAVARRTEQKKTLRRAADTAKQVRPQQWEDDRLAHDLFHFAHRSPPQREEGIDTRGHFADVSPANHEFVTDDETTRAAAFVILRAPTDSSFQKRRSKVCVQFRYPRNNTQEECCCAQLLVQNNQKIDRGGAGFCCRRCCELGMKLRKIAAFWRANEVYP